MISHIVPFSSQLYKNLFLQTFGYEATSTRTTGGELYCLEDNEQVVGWVECETTYSGTYLAWGGFVEGKKRAGYIFKALSELDRLLPKKQKVMLVLNTNNEMLRIALKSGYTIIGLNVENNETQLKLRKG